MKTIKKIPALLIGALSTVLLLSSCSNEDEGTVSLSGEMVELRVATPQIAESDESTEITKSGIEVPQPQTVTVPGGNGMVMEATLEPAPVTRGTTALATGVKYRVIAFNKTVNRFGKPELEYVSYADYEVGTTEPIANSLHVPAGVTYTFVCYSLNSTATLPAFNEDILFIDINSATDDLLYAKFDQIITSSGQTLTFSLVHKFMQVTVIADATEIGKDISDISTRFHPKNYNYLSLCLSTGYFYNYWISDFSIPWGIINVGQTIKSIPFTILHTYYVDIRIYVLSITIDGTTYRGLGGIFRNTSWQIGHRYTLRLKFKSSPNNSDGIALAGLIWARGNLIYKTSDFSRRFADSQEYSSGNPYGYDFWTWMQSHPFESPYGNNGVDPCNNVYPYPRNTWRMPTGDECYRLHFTESTGGFKKGKFGAYFGINTIPSPGTENNYLFLPAAGYVRSDNSGHKKIEGAGYAYYWTSDASYAGIGGVAAPFSMFVKPDESCYVVINKEKLTLSLPIRCVKNQ